METLERCSAVWSVQGSSYRTYEEWKLFPCWGWVKCWVSSYRTYEEWKHPLVSLKSFSPSVLTVPMRNGNTSWTIMFIEISFRSYRTYEEWKHTKTMIRQATDILFLPYLWGMETYGGEIMRYRVIIVLTVPMRNGNCRTSSKQHRTRLSCSYRTYEEWKLRDEDTAWHCGTTFLPYLWGMETCFWPFFKYLLFFVLTVPMRNGNLLKRLGEACLCRFLPYLWGMETSIWKYTRKAWITSSYRTYEEWKRSLVSLLFVGISSVLTVPMRNGNFLDDLQRLLVGKFLPYLWGMETKKLARQHGGDSIRSYRTYEEWKLVEQA